MIKPILHFGITLLFVFNMSCGEESDSSDDMNTGGNTMTNPADGSSNTGSASCQVDDDCSDIEYCQAADPLSSPSGQCSPLQVEGDICRRGTACVDNLVCIKDRATGEGTCRAFPDLCSTAPSCECALESFCVALAGSSCSVEIVNQPASSMTATCAEIQD